LLIKKLACKSGIAGLRDKTGMIVTDDCARANLLNDFFSSVCTRDNGVLPSLARKAPDDVSLSDVSFSAVSVAAAIKKLKANVACGPDGMPPIMFKKLTQSLSWPLSLIFSSFMSVGRWTNTS
jgi:hypothetical protein